MKAIGGLLIGVGLAWLGSALMMETTVVVVSPTYQVPMEVPPARQLALAMRWIVGYATARKNVPLVKALATELKEAAIGQGNAIKKRDDTHKMAQANRAFAHFRF